MSDTTTERGRAGFWRRVIAFLVDGFLIALALGLVGLLLYGPTGGSIRVSSMVIGARHCVERSLEALQELNSILPANLHPTHVVTCTRSLLGHVYDRRLIVAEVTRSGSVTYSRDIQFPIDADGHPMRAFYLDELSFPLLAIYLALLLWRVGRTIGMDLMSIRVRSLDGGLPTFLQAAKRVLFISAPGILFAVLWLTLLGFGISVVPAIFWTIWALSFSLAAAIAINFIITARRGERPWHDRFAGTEVVMGR